MSGANIEVGLAAASDLLDANCPGRELFELVTNRWTLLILWALKGGTLRFYALRDSVEGISERVLSQNLKALCRAGLIERKVEPTIPPKVSYTLLPSSYQLLDIMGRLTSWIGENVMGVRDAQRRYDQGE
jgi:DNA-binding HxlR family transcriptional regulator